MIVANFTAGFYRLREINCRRATAHYCATASCTNDHSIHVFRYTTNLCVANNTIVVKRKRRAFVANAEAHARYRNIQLASHMHVAVTQYCAVARERVNSSAW